MAFNEPSVTQLLPNTGLLSLRQVIGDKALGIQPLIPVSRSGFFQGIKDGVYPAGVIVGKRRRMWLASTIAAWVAAQGGAQ